MRSTVVSLVLGIFGLFGSACVASQGQGAMPSSHKLTGITLEPVSDKGQANLKEFSRTVLMGLHDHWLPPTDFEDNFSHPWPVETIIAVTVSPSGQVTSDLDSTSEDENLDRAAWRAVKATAFPLPPQGLKDPVLRMRVHFKAK